MPSSLRSGRPPIGTWEIALAGALLVLCVVLVLRTHRLVPRDEVVGSYRPDPSYFLRSLPTPTRIDLAADGRFSLVAEDGHTTLAGTWWWDATEGMVRSEEEAVDRRIRAYRGWGSTTLLWRCPEGLDGTEEVTLHALE